MEIFEKDLIITNTSRRYFNINPNIFVLVLQLKIQKLNTKFNTFICKFNNSRNTVADQIMEDNVTILVWMMGVNTDGGEYRHLLLIG